MSEAAKNITLMELKKRLPLAGGLETHWLELGPSSAEIFKSLATSLLLSIEADISAPIFVPDPGSRRRYIRVRREPWTPTELLERGLQLHCAGLASPQKGWEFRAQGEKLWTLSRKNRKSIFSGLDAQVELEAKRARRRVQLGRYLEFRYEQNSGPWAVRTYWGVVRSRTDSTFTIAHAYGVRTYLFERLVEAQKFDADKERLEPIRFMRLDWRQGDVTTEVFFSEKHRRESVPELNSEPLPSLTRGSLFSLNRIRQNWFKAQERKF